MISSEDVRRVTFDKAMRGYRCDDVDDYLKQVAESMDALAAKNDEMQKNLVVLAQRIDQYRAEEDTLRTTMINAQRLGENVIREAKQKAAEIIRAANMKADDREQRARDDVELAKQEIVTLKTRLRRRKPISLPRSPLLTSLMLSPPPRLCLIPSLSRHQRLCRSRNHRPPATITPLKLPPRRSRPLWPSPPRKR